jgi:hypothetical protein
MTQSNKKPRDLTDYVISKNQVIQELPRIRHRCHHLTRSPTRTHQRTAEEILALIKRRIQDDQDLC